MVTGFFSLTSRAAWGSSQICEKMVFSRATISIMRWKMAQITTDNCMVRRTNWFPRVAPMRPHEVTAQQFEFPPDVDVVWMNWLLMSAAALSTRTLSSFNY